MEYMLFGSKLLECGFLLKWIPSNVLLRHGPGLRSLGTPRARHRRRPKWSVAACQKVRNLRKSATIESCVSVEASEAFTRSNGGLRLAGGCEFGGKGVSGDSKLARRKRRHFRNGEPAGGGGALRNVGWRPRAVSASRLRSATASFARPAWVFVFLAFQYGCLGATS